MMKLRSLTLLALLIEGVASHGYAQIEPPEPVPPGSMAPSQGVDPLNVQPAFEPLSPFATPLEFQPSITRPEPADSRDLVLQPEMTQPQRVTLEPIADRVNPEKFGTLNASAAMFQVPLGQGRILTLKDKFTEGDDEPLVAIGNPGIVDVVIVSDRQFRLTGIRVGVTDLSVTTAKGDTIHYEIQVVADLVTLQKKIQLTFPDASVHLSQIQNNVVVEGQARSQLQVTQIIAMVTAYLDAMTALQRMSARGSGGGTGGLAGNLEAAAISPAGIADARSNGNPPVEGGAV